MPRIDAFLQILSQVGASDLHIGDGSEPLVRINGSLEKTKHKVLSIDEVRLVLYELLTDRQIEKFEQTGEIDIAYTLEGFARFRVNIFKKHPGLAAAFRLIPRDLPTLDGVGRIAALEIMVRNHAVGNLIREAKTHQITNTIVMGRNEGMQLMDDHLKQMISQNLVTAEEAARFSENPQTILAHGKSVGASPQIAA
jgi:twitching motility protein PilT